MQLLIMIAKEQLKLSKEQATNKSPAVFYYKLNYSSIDMI